MNTPPLLLAAACALWGAQSGHWLVAALAAAALEAPRVAPLRWNLAQAHFNRLSDFCSILIVALAGYLYFTFGNPRALLLLFQWLPIALMPIALAQAWGNLPRVGVAAFVWTLRKDPVAEQQTVNIGYPYFVVWLLAASATNVPGLTFSAGLMVLAGWALWAARPQRYSPAVWIGLVVLAGTIGYGVHTGLARLQGWVEDTVPEWLTAGGARTDPYSSRTDLGRIGELKLDDAIALRVRPEGGLVQPLLLHRATYNGYFGNTWAARNASLTPRPPDAAERWVLADSVAVGQRVAIFDYSPRGNPVLSLPRGTVEVTGLSAPSIKLNRLGAVQAELPPGHLRYTAVVDARASIDAGPDDEDLRVPRNDYALLVQLATDAGFTGLSPDAAVARVREFFAQGFAYSTYQPQAARGPSPLADFLLRTRAGHCEYFATATALLLRTAGVPARYATGFSVQEYSRLEEAYVVRVRHAHAWVKAWVNGSWIDVDTTPATWAAVEAESASLWSPAADLWSWTRFRLSHLVAGARDETATAALWTGVALLLMSWFGWRLYRQRRLLVIGSGTMPAERARPIRIGADSEFFMIESALERSGFPREPGETVLAWLARIESKLPESMEKAELAELAELHYRYRFDPGGLLRYEREELKTSAQSWLARHAAR